MSNMPKTSSIRVKYENFPDNVAELDTFYRKQTGEEGVDIKFYLHLHGGMKVDISDLNIENIKKDYIRGMKEVEIFAERIFIKDQISESIIMEYDQQANFEERFKLISTEILNCLKNNGDINQAASKVKGIKGFDNFTKIIQIYSEKISQLEKEREIAAMIVSDLEDLTIKYKIQTEELKKQTGTNNIFANNFVNNNGLQFHPSINGQIDDIIKSLKECHKELNNKRAYFDNKELTIFFSSEHFLNGSDKNETKIQTIHQYLQAFKFVPSILLESLDLNSLYNDYKNKLKKTIFCNLCNEFKKPSNSEYKICERHLICENCYKNYAKKIKCIKEKLCYCQAKVV